MKKILTIIFATSLLVSCADDFTEIDPVGSLSDASLQNATGVDLLLTGAYSVLDGMRNGGPGADWTKSGDNWWLDAISDDAHKGSTDGDQADLLAIELFTWDTTNPYFEGRWQALFAGVNRANAVIDLINNSDNPSDFSVQKAQAQFLRGHYNFEIQRMWVNVPYISDENYAASEFNPIGAMTGGMCCGFYQPTIDLANAFQTDSNGLPLAAWATTDITNDYGVYETEAHTPHSGPLDPRIDFTVGRRGVDLNGFGPMTGKDNIRASFTDISGPFVNKKNLYTAGDDTNRGTGGWGEQRTGINYHILRYADVLLMAAEAAVESGNLETGRNYVNQVRARAKNGPRADASPNYVIDTYNSTWTDQAAARNAVRHERRVEMAMEGHRLFDLRRWNIMVDALNTYIANEGRTIANFAAKANPVSAKHNALPIPLNNPKAG